MWRCKCKCKWWGNCLKPYQKWSKRFKAPSCFQICFSFFAAALCCIMRIMHSQRWAQRAPSCQTMKARPICSHFEEQEPVSNERAGVSGQTWNANECKWKLMANGGTGEIIWAWQVQDVLSVCRMRCVCVCVCMSVSWSMSCMSCNSCVSKELSNFAASAAPEPHSRGNHFGRSLKRA